MQNLNKSCYKNPICQKCIKKHIEKYGANNFNIDCQGITIEEDVKFAIKNGMTEHEARWAFDVRYFMEVAYGHPPRDYQLGMLCCTSRKLVARYGRQQGKSLTACVRLLHMCVTQENFTVLIVTPMEIQVRKLYTEYFLNALILNNATLKASMVSKSMSPAYEIVFDNGSKLTMMVCGSGARGQTANILYVDEAAIIPRDMLADILMVTASKTDASIFMTSTPKSRGDMFYKACMEDNEYSEFHVSIYDVKEMEDRIPFFKSLLDDTQFQQEAEALFLSSAGGPFNTFGVNLAKSPYEYEDCIKENGFLYHMGIDWNGPNVGTYFYVFGFNPDTGQIKAVDKQVVSSAIWNSTLAKQTFIELNRKWNPKTIMVDYGYSSAICEDLKLFSIRAEKEGMLPHNHPDCMIKYTLEPVQFGGWVDVEDPFSREINKKTTRGFMVAEISKLFEPQHNDTYVPISFPASDLDLIESLENYKLINTTSKGTDQYGFEKGSGIEDHCYTPGHELLTRNGWKKIEDITLEDEVAAPDRFGRLKYEKPSRIINKDYDDEIYKVNTRGISFEVTNKHRLPYVPAKKYFNKNWEIQSEPINELTPYLLKTPAAALDYDKSDYNMKDEEIYLLGMFLAEGCTNINHNHYRTIWDQKNEVNIVKIRNAMEVVYPSIYSERISKIGVTRFEIQKMAIYNKYKKYGKSRQKYIDREYLDGFSKRQLKILWDGLMDGDGHYEYGPHGGSHYDTVSIQLANDFQELCVKLGIKTTFQKLKTPVGIGPRQQSYRIGIHKSEPFHTYTKKAFKIEHYNGKVHCVTITDGLLIVRHNGKVHIGSNCIDAHNLALYGIVKHYSELFKRIIAPSAPIYGREIFTPNKDTDDTINISHSQSIILLTDNSPDPINLDERSLKKFEPKEKEDLLPIISRTFNKSIDRRQISNKRSNYIVNRLLPF